MYIEHIDDCDDCAEWYGDDECNGHPVGPESPRERMMRHSIVDPDELRAWLEGRKAAGRVAS